GAGMPGEQCALQELGMRRLENKTHQRRQGALPALPAGGHLGRELRAGRSVGGRVRAIPHRDVSRGELQAVRHCGDDFPGTREIPAGHARQTDPVNCRRRREKSLTAKPLKSETRYLVSYKEPEKTRRSKAAGIRGGDASSPRVKCAVPGALFRSSKADVTLIP